MSDEWKVATLEQSKRLVELGIMLETEKRWVTSPNGETHLRTDFKSMGLPAPDVAELGVVLPCVIVTGNSIIYTTVSRNGVKFRRSQDVHGLPDKSVEINYGNEAQARCAALIWLIENDYLKPEDIK